MGNSLTWRSCYPSSTHVATSLVARISVVHQSPKPKQHMLGSIELHRTCPEVLDNCSEVLNIPENFLKSKLKIKFFEMLLQFHSRELAMIKMKTMKVNCMKKKTK